MGMLVGCPPSRSPTVAATNQCDNGLDQDGDGLVDCDDPDCYGSAVCGGVPASSREIDWIQWNCENSSDYAYHVETVGWAGDMTLEIFETGAWGGLSNPTSFSGWEEFHSMYNVAFAEDGSWDIWELDLVHVDSVSDVVAGSTTLFDCQVHLDDSLAWKTSMFDDSFAPVDCGIWGFDAEDYWNTTVGDECVCFDCT